MMCWQFIHRELVAGRPCSLVSIVEAEGSSPREVGARMVVTADGFHGTIGGGTLEWKAMAAAQALQGKPAGVRIQSFALGPQLGQCCGGRVKLAVESFDQSNLGEVTQLAAREAQGPFSLVGRMAALPELQEEFGEPRRAVYLFGAGHVGRALVLMLAQLPFTVHWIDPRANAFPAAVPANAVLHQPDDPVAMLADAPMGSLVLVMTHSHALDLAITDAALRNPACAEVGLIGSATKRARFEARLRAAGVDGERVAGLVCPIGVAGISSKEPAAIALSTAAQLLVFDERLKACNSASGTAGLEKRLAGQVGGTG